MSYITNLLESIRGKVTIYKEDNIYSIKVPPETKSEVNKILVSSYIDQQMLLLYADKCLNVKLLMDELAKQEAEAETKPEAEAAAEGGSRRQATRGRKRTIKKKKTRKKRGSRKNKK